MRTIMLTFVLFVGTLAQAATASSFQELIDSYLERYFHTFPSRATAAGRHDLDRELEDLSASRRSAWLDFNRTFRTQLMAAPKPSLDDQLDAELLLRRIDQEIHRAAVLRVPERDPLYWAGILGNATVLLLVRDDLPESERVSRALDRAQQLPRLCQQARAALGGTSPSMISPEIARLATEQVKATAAFYRERFPSLRASDPPFQAESTKIADALSQFAGFLQELANRASGSPRLGKDYAETFRLGTGVTTPVPTLLAQAEEDLRRERAEAAAFGRSVWNEFMTGAAPAGDVAVVRGLFARVAQDHAKDSSEFVEEFRRFVDEAETFVRQHQVVTLPEPRTIIIQLSPAFFLGQSVGSVSGTGPYNPKAKTLFYLPSPPPAATAEQKEAFYRDFNSHFARMITPHEIMPGHYVEGKYAAMNPHKVRALFGDGVALEGWGTFSERVMLDLGWGGPLDRLAHMKKQMENIARTIMDIRIHTTSISREEVIRFVKEEALQDDQFANNLWVRGITSSPQMTSYYLGYGGLWEVYQALKRKSGSGFKPKDYTDAVMKLGPVPVYRVREDDHQDLTKRVQELGLD